MTGLDRPACASGCDGDRASGAPRGISRAPARTTPFRASIPACNPACSWRSRSRSSAIGRSTRPGTSTPSPSGMQSTADLRFQEAVVQTVAAVKQAYWTFKATLANVTVQQQSLQLAEQLARENKIRVDAGQIPPLDLVQAEAEVAGRRENLIRARTLSEDAEDALRRLIIDPADASFWQVRLQPVEEPTRLADLPDVNAAVEKALAGRFDLARAAQELENAKSTVEFLDNQRLPDVRLETSYRGSGLGGTEFLRSGGFPGSIIGTRNRGVGDALGQAFTGDYPAWSLGVSVSYPIGRSYEASSMARAEVERQQVTQRIASLRVQTAEMVRRVGAPDSQHGRARGRRARDRHAGRAATRLRAPPVRCRTVHHLSRDAGATRPARSPGESAADDAGLRVGAGHIRSRATGVAARRGIDNRGARRDYSSADASVAARRLPPGFRRRTMIAGRADQVQGSKGPGSKGPRCTFGPSGQGRNDVSLGCGDRCALEHRDSSV